MSQDRDIQKLRRHAQADAEDALAKAQLHQSMIRALTQAIYNDEEEAEIRELLQRPSQEQVTQALQKLRPGRSPRVILSALARAVYSTTNEVRHTLIQHALKHLAHEDIVGILARHPFLGYKFDTYCWYSERTYNPDGEQVLDALNDFKRYAPIYERLFQSNPVLRTSYRESVHILWITFHSRAAEPLLVDLCSNDPQDADSFFYLGQIYQDSVQDLERAKECFETFLELRPQHSPEENNFVPETWYFNYHKYKASSVEALVNLAQINYQQSGDREALRQSLLKAVENDPLSHLAPYPQLAQLALEEQRTIEAAQYYEKATAAYRKARFTNGSFLPNCEYYEELNAWLIEKYPHFQTAFSVYGSYFLEDREQLLIRAFREGLDPEQCLKILGPLRKERKRTRSKVNPDIVLIQMEIIFERYKDYYQISHLAALIPDNEKAQEWLSRANKKLGRA